MSDDDYLWDPRSRGPRDPLVERLERALQVRQLEPRRRGIRPLVILPLAAATVVLGLVGWQVYAGGEAAHPPAAPQAFHAREGEALEAPSAAPSSLASGDVELVDTIERVDGDADAAIADAGPVNEDDAVATDEEDVTDPEVEATPEEPVEAAAELTGR